MIQSNELHTESSSRRDRYCPVLGDFGPSSVYLKITGRKTKTKRKKKEEKKRMREKEKTKTGKIKKKRQ